MSGETTTWWCQACDEHGQGDRGAEKHTKATGHSTITSGTGFVAAGRVQP